MVLSLPCPGRETGGPGRETGGPRRETEGRGPGLTGTDVRQESSGWNGETRRRNLVPSYSWFRDLHLLGISDPQSSVPLLISSVPISDPKLVPGDSGRPLKYLRLCQSSGVVTDFTLT